MPQIPRAKRQVGEPDRTMNVQYGAEQAEARGLSDLGKGIQNFASAVGTMQKSRKDLTDNIVVDDALNAYYAKRAPYLAQQGAKSGKTVIGVTNEYNAWHSTTEQELTAQYKMTPEQIALFKSKVGIQYRSDVDKIALFEHKQTAQAAQEVMMQTNNSIADSVFAGGDIDTALSMVMNNIDTYNNLAVIRGTIDPDGLVELRRVATVDIFRAAVTGQMQANPEEMEKALHSKSATVNIAGKEYDLVEIMGKEEVGKLREQSIAAVKRDRVEKEYQTKKYNEETTSKYLSFMSEYMSNPGSVLKVTPDMIEKSNLPGDIKIKLTDAVNNITEKRYRESNPSTVSMFIQKIVADSSSVTEEEIVNMIGSKANVGKFPDDWVSINDALMLRGLLTNLNKEGGGKARFGGRYAEVYKDIVQYIDFLEKQSALGSGEQGRQRKTELLADLVDWYSVNKDVDPTEWSKKNLVHARLTAGQAIESIYKADAYYDPQGTFFAYGGKKIEPDVEGTVMAEQKRTFVKLMMDKGATRDEALGQWFRKTGQTK